MHQIFFSIKGCADVVKLPIDEGARYQVYSNFNIDLQQWELVLVK